MAYDSSLANQLAAVRDAINRCLTSQEYSIRGRTQQMAQLGDLRALEKELLAQQVQEGSSFATVGVQSRPG